MLNGQDRSSKRMKTSTYGIFRHIVILYLISLQTTTVFDTFLHAQSLGDPAATRTLEPLKLRYFSPSELLRIFAFDTTRGESVSRLMDPAAGTETGQLTWPDTVSLKSKYKLIGNSVNVHVVQQLIEYLFLEPEAVQITDVQ